MERFASESRPLIPPVIPRSRHGSTHEETAHRAVGLALPHLILTMALLHRDANTVAGSPASDAQTTSPLHRKRGGGVCRASRALSVF